MSNSRYDIVIVVIVVAHRSSQVSNPYRAVRGIYGLFLRRARGERACEFYDSARLRQIFNPRETGEPLWLLTPGEMLC